VIEQQRESKEKIYFHIFSAFPQRDLRASAVKYSATQSEMTPEQQIEELNQLGLSLNDGVTIDDFLYSWDRKEYEEMPFDLLLITFGFEIEREPEGRFFCDQAWDFDVECVYESGIYVEIVTQLCRVAGMPNLITNAEDFVDVENGEAWLRYTIDGKARDYTIAVDNDLADPETVTVIMKDIERDGKRFYAKKNGQASTWFDLDEVTARKINALTGNLLAAND
jgi:hypothetical protein